MRIIFILLLLPCFMFAQKAEREVISLSSEDFVSLSEDEIGKSSEWIGVPIEADPFLAFSVAWKYSGEESLAIYYHFEGDENNWTLLQPDDHYFDEAGRQVSTLIYRESHQKKLQLHLADAKGNSGGLEYMDLHFYSPGKTLAPESIKQVSPEKFDFGDCPCPQPGFLNRQGWCPNGDCTENANPQFTDVTHIIVHHSAGTNASSDWSGVVRSIWDYHVNTRGWDDIGYNWLVDPNGVLYEGRGDNIRGAHFCAHNTGTVGICVLGDFTNTTPAANALDKLTEFLSWKTCDANIDPEGSAFHNSSDKVLPLIAGHRQGCSTECPGEQFFPLFSELRSGVKTYRDQECKEFNPPSQLKAWAVSETKIQLHWKDNSGIETAFLLERSKDNNGEYSEIAVLPENTNYYTDADLIPSTTYFYRVRAAMDSDTTAYSNEDEVATILTGNHQLENDQTTIEVQPNPSIGPIHLTLEGAYRGQVKITMYDIANGRSMQEWTFDKEESRAGKNLIVKNTSSGIFILRVEMEEEVTYIKIIRL